MSRPIRLSCPFCGSAGLVEAYTDDGDNCVECGDCGAKGPGGDTVTEAWDKWNAREKARY